MVFNAITFLLSRSIAERRGVANPNRIGLVGGVLRPPVLGIVAASALSNGEAVVSPPLIVEQPADLTVAEGDVARFTVRATGSAPLRFQWRLDGKPIAGATTATLELKNVQTKDAGKYSLEVNNSFGTTISGDATLTVGNEVPPVLLTKVTDAEAVLSNPPFNFKVIKVGAASPVTKDQVINQQPARGIFPFGTEITLTVSTGRAVI